MKNEKIELLEKGAFRNLHMMGRALEHNLRRRILNLYISHGKLTNKEVYIKLRIEQSLASQHMAILIRVGLLVGERQGKHIFYRLDKAKFDKVEAARKSLAA